MHVLRAKKPVEKRDSEKEASADDSSAPRKKLKRGEEAADEDDGNGFEGQDDFIQFPAAPVDRASEEEETDASVESTSSEAEDDAQEDTGMA